LDSPTCSYNLSADAIFRDDSDLVSLLGRITGRFSVSWRHIKAQVLWSLSNITYFTAYHGKCRIWIFLFILLPGIICAGWISREYAVCRRIELMYFKSVWCRARFNVRDGQSSVVTLVLVDGWEPYQKWLVLLYSGQGRIGRNRAPGHQQNNWICKDHANRFRWSGDIKNMEGSKYMVPDKGLDENGPVDMTSIVWKWERILGLHIHSFRY